MNETNLQYAHTPGPWMIFPQGDIGSASVRRPDTVVIQAGRVKGQTIGEAMANARLIAAAPELLEELRSIRGYLSLIQTAHIGSVIRDRIEQIDALISKATLGHY